jgi:hypothetical protein
MTSPKDARRAYVVVSPAVAWARHRPCRRSLRPTERGHLVAPTCGARALGGASTAGLGVGLVRCLRAQTFPQSQSQRLPPTGFASAGLQKFDHEFELRSRTGYRFSGLSIVDRGLREANGRLLSSALRDQLTVGGVGRLERRAQSGSELGSRILGVHGLLL